MSRVLEKFPIYVLFVKGKGNFSDSFRYQRGDFLTSPLTGRKLSTKHFFTVDTNNIMNSL
jgi:hypothetical protein